jgi:hypothetical protein
MTSWPTPDHGHLVEATRVHRAPHLTERLRTVWALIARGDAVSIDGQHWADHQYCDLIDIVPMVAVPRGDVSTGDVDELGTPSLLTGMETT